jgi:hypothetical protein
MATPYPVEITGAQNFGERHGKKRTMTLSHRIKDLDQFKPGQTISMAITDELVVEAVRT